MAWLKRAVAAGYDNADHMEQDKDPSAVPDRANFTKLMAVLQACPPEKKPSPRHAGEEAGDN